MSVDLWIEITEENIERLADLYSQAYPGASESYVLFRVALGNYVNFDTSYTPLEVQIDVYESTDHMHEFSRLVDIDEFMLAIFENTLNQ